jgi:hypothetical protein
MRFGRPRKRTPHQREAPLRRLEAGETQSDVARTYNVDPTTIGRLQWLLSVQDQGRRRIWKASCVLQLGGFLMQFQCTGSNGRCWRMRHCACRRAATRRRSKS